VGLFSGIDYASLVDQLITIDARPRNLLTSRISAIDAQRTAWLDISARIAALLARVNSLKRTSLFRAATATSSNSQVLSATAAEGAAPGTYSFIVRALATTQQLVSRAFASTDALLTPGTLTIESAAAKVNRSTRLDELNGYRGVRRGSFQITDGNGQTATIDISDALTLAEVLDRINQAGIGIRAELRGEAIVLRDTSGGGQGIRVREVGDGHTAADLGFGAGHTYSQTGELIGSNIFYLAETTPLAALNDGLGLRRAAAGIDFTIQSTDPSVTVNVRLSEIITNTTRLERLNHARGVELGRVRITTRDGRSTEVDLTGATTIGDVKQLIEQTVSGISVIMSGSRLIITDTTGASTTNLTIEDVTGHAARDLGIAGSSSSSKIDGRKILYVDTLGDVVAAINYAEGNRLAEGRPVIEAAISSDGQRLVLTDHAGGTFPSMVLSVPEGTNSRALQDLGFSAGPAGSFDEPLQGRRILGGIDTVLLARLNGGSGFTGGLIRVAANGSDVDVDLTEAETLRDVIERINAAAAGAGLEVRAGIDVTGTRLLIENLASDTNPVSISDLSGNFAQSLQLTEPANRLRSANLQRQYISELTRLADLNLGRGVAAGKFRITDSRGLSAVVDLSGSQAQTLGDVINAINSLSTVQVEARINDTGDGLLIIDRAGGSGTLRIVEEGSTTARDLNILGQAAAGTGQIDGSFELRIELTGAQSLSGLATRINSTTLASANLIRSGTALAPWRLSITSRGSGLAGELVVDAGTTGLDFSTLTRPQDAAVVFGDSASGLLVTSSSNTLSDVVPGLTLALTGTSDQPVTVTVSRNVDALVETLKGLADAYNSIKDRLSQVNSYDAETQQQGVLFGDSLVQTIEQRLFRLFSGTVTGANTRFTRWNELGIGFGSGGRLQFDEQKFRNAYEAAPDEVAGFFTASDVGAAARAATQLQRITESGGLIRQRENALISQKEELNRRVESLNELLERKRQRLLRQFWAMEQALAQLQAQQQAITGLSSSLSSFGNLFRSQSG